MKRLIIFLLFLICSQVFATPYYVDQNATGNGSGSSWTNASTTVVDLPWSSIKGGDTVYVSGGSDSTVYSAGHSGIASVNYIVSITAIGNPIVITKGREAGHNGDVYFDQKESPMRSSGYSFQVNACHNIKLTNLIFTTEMADGVDDYSSCLLFASSSNCIVDNCQIISNGSTNGIWFDTSDSITVNNCTITVLSNNLARGQDNIHTDYGNGGHTFTNNKFYNYGYNSYPHNDLIQFTYP